MHEWVGELNYEIRGAKTHGITHKSARFAKSEGYDTGVARRAWLPGTGDQALTAPRAALDRTYG